MAKSDKDAIVEVIERRRKAFATHDFETYSQLHAHVPYVTWWNASPVSGNFVRTGWDETAPLLREWMASTEKETRGSDDAINENLVVRVSDSIAWVTFTRRYPLVPPHRAGPNPAHQLRILEKHDGEWKVVLGGFLDPTTSAPRAAPVLRLDEDGRILWKNGAADTALGTDTDLHVSKGKLHFRNSKADRSLYEGIRWATDLGKQFIPRRGSLPIVVDGGHGVPARVCWVISDAGTVLFSMGEPDRAERQLDVAAIIFRLSAAQKTLAAHVLAGRSIEQAASLMGIKASSARTHLGRVYSKTGVRTHGSLIRVLLSVAAPI